MTWEKPKPGRYLVPFEPGERQAFRKDERHRGPLITPALRRFAMMPILKLERMLADPARQAQLTVGEGVALALLEKGLYDRAWGDRAREEIIRRLDGNTPETIFDPVNSQGTQIIVINTEPPLGF